MLQQIIDKHQTQVSELLKNCFSLHTFDSQEELNQIETLAQLRNNTEAMSKEIVRALEKYANDLRRMHYIEKYPFLCDLISKNDKYRDCHKGKRCFVLGNGPSLNEFDFSLLENEVVFTVNYLTEHPDFASLKTNYHFFADTAFFKLHAETEVDKFAQGRMFSIIKMLRQAAQEPVCFVSTEGYELFRRNNLHKCKGVAFYGSPLRFYNRFDEEFDYSMPTVAFDVVPLWALSMAIYMGFSEIYILGCDCTGMTVLIDEAYQCHAYSECQFEKKMGVNSRREYGAELEITGWGRVIHTFGELGVYCKERGILLANCSRKSLLDNLPYYDLKHILQK